PHLQLPARPRDRPPHQSDALQDRQGPERRGARRDRRRAARRGPGGEAGGGAMTVAADTRVETALADATARLSAAAVPDARRDARLLVASAPGWEAARVLAYPEAELTAAASRRLDDLLTRRTAREPISRILGYREFWSLRFELSADTLDPRPDSETLIEAAL